MPRLFRATLLALVLPLAAAAQADTQQSLPEIVSSASAERAVPANLAVVSVRFSRDGATAAEAGRRVALAADTLRRALARLGIPGDSVVNGSRWYWWNERIQQFEENRSSSRWIPCAPNGSRCRSDTSWVEVRFRANENLQIRIHDLGRVGAVIDTLLAHGHLSIGDISFAATDTEKEQREAMREATERAVARATTIAQAGGGRLGRTLRLSTDGDGQVRYSPFDYLTVSSLGAQRSAGSTVVVSPVLHVTATVHGRWEFLPGN